MHNKSKSGTPGRKRGACIALLCAVYGSSPVAKQARVRCWHAGTGSCSGSELGTTSKYNTLFAAQVTQLAGRRAAQKSRGGSKGNRAQRRSAACGARSDCHGGYPLVPVRQCACCYGWAVLRLGLRCGAQQLAALARGGRSRPWRAVVPI